MRYLKPVVAAALAFSMTAAPVLAQSAAPLSVSHAFVEGDSDGTTNRSYLLPAVVIIAVLAAAILLVSNNGKDHPSSP
jgi:hypothetical protein